MGERLDGIEKVRGSSPLTSIPLKPMTGKQLWVFPFLRRIWGAVGWTAAFWSAMGDVK